MGDGLVQTFKAFVEVATGASGTIEAIVSAVRGVKGLVQPAQGHSEAEMEAAISKLASAVEYAQLHNRLLQLHVAKLEDDLRRSDERRDQLKAYTLYRMPTGYSVYALQDPNKTGDYSHIICTNCHVDGIPSILLGSDTVKVCPRCKTRFSLQDVEFGTSYGED